MQSSNDLILDFFSKNSFRNTISVMAIQNVPVWSAFFTPPMILHSRLFYRISLILVAEDFLILANNAEPDESYI